MINDDASEGQTRKLKIVHSIARGKEEEEPAKRCTIVTKRKESVAVKSGSGGELEKQGGNYRFSAIPFGMKIFVQCMFGRDSCHVGKLARDKADNDCFSANKVAILEMNF